MPDSASSGLSAHQLSAAQRVGIMVTSWWPLLHVVAVVAVGVAPWGPWGARLAASLGVLYLVPPLLARLVLRLSPLVGPRHPVGSRGYMTWWLLLTLQTVFCRFPALDEALRMVPALYSAWLRLWGSRVGRLTYWAPGMQVYDRSFLEVGDDVIFGAGVVLSPHLVVREPDRSMDLVVAPIRIGHRCLIGGFSALAGGTRVAPDEAPRAFSHFPPFTDWRDGKRNRRGDGQE